jgi:hypothetical protein
MAGTVAATGASSRGIDSILRRRNVAELRASYCEKPLALFTGAGVSRSTTPGLGIDGWDALLSEIERTLGAERAPACEGAEPHPWDRADALAKRFGEDALQDQIVKLVRREGHFQSGKYKLPRKAFRESLPTASALAAFCARLVAVSSSAHEKPRYYGRFRPNPRVPAVVSTNYDPFLEATASGKFHSKKREHLLKPVGALGSTAGSLAQIPVYHVHGYVSPWPDQKAKPASTPFVDPVLTGKAYDRAWEDEAYSPTIGPQVHVLRHFPTLFVGFSFRDEHVNELLKTLADERRGRGPQHFALVDSKALDAGRRDWFDARGVQAIRWCEPGEIPCLLAYLYAAGLESDIERSGSVRIDEIEPGKGGRRTGRGVGMALRDVSYLWKAVACADEGRVPKPPRWPRATGRRNKGA